MCAGRCIMPRLKKISIQFNKTIANVLRSIAGSRDNMILFVIASEDMNITAEEYMKDI
jgi:hypothetical protein